jgi:hypothetical protein
MLGLWILEYERRPAALGDAVEDIRDLELRIDLGGDANELSFRSTREIQSRSSRGGSTGTSGESPDSYADARGPRAYAMAASRASARPSAKSAAVRSASCGRSAARVASRTCCS